MTDETPPRLTVVEDGDLADIPPTREELLDAVPLHVQVWPEVDLDAEDPAALYDGGRRCIAARKAGGRCTVRAMADSLLCAAHSGRLDSSAGGRALAEKYRNRRNQAEEAARFAALGTRAVVVQALQEKAAEIRATIHALADAGAQGDLRSAQALIPWLNQGLGTPTETVALTAPQSDAELASMPTEALARLLQDLREAS